MKTSSMYVMALSMPLNTSAVSRLNEAGAPCKPWLVRVHLNCVLMYGSVNAVMSLESSASFCCQNPDAISKVENMVEPAFPIMSMHSVTSLIAYLSSYEAAFIFLRSCTILKLPSFFWTQNTGEL